MSSQKGLVRAMMTPDEVVHYLKDRPDIRLVGIDGLPVSGKSTLAERLIEVLGAEIIYFDDFILPKTDWPKPINPGFPFLYARSEEFFRTVEDVAAGRVCSYRLYDWASGTLGEIRTIGGGTGPIFVEGVSALCERLSPLYDLRIWVESDAETTLDAALARGVGAWERDWREIFIPSVERYMQTRPKERADIVVAGRGA